MKAKNARGYSGKLSECPFSEQFSHDLLTPFLDTYQNERTKKELSKRIRTICGYFYRQRGCRYEFHMLGLEDAKNYFLYYLPKLCENMELSYSTLCAELSAARSFGTFLEKHISLLRESGDFTYAPYHSPFFKIQRPPVITGIRMDTPSDALTDQALAAAEEYDERLFIILLLSFRMTMLESTILSLKKEMFTFVTERNRSVGIIGINENGTLSTRRIPDDILEDVMSYVISSPDGYLFTNKWGNRLSAANLSRMLSNMERDIGVHVTAKQMRAKGLLDMVAQNPDSLDEISSFTGLSKNAIGVYGNALDRIGGSCSVADNTSYRIIKKSERGAFSHE